MNQIYSYSRFASLVGMIILVVSLGKQAAGEYRR
jgi:hypothetical protein